MPTSTFLLVQSNRLILRSSHLPPVPWLFYSGFASRCKSSPQSFDDDMYPDDLQLTTCIVTTASTDDMYSDDRFY
jgi:hypothetical protein